MPSTILDTEDKTVREKISVLMTFRSNEGKQNKWNNKLTVYYNIISSLKINQK